MVPCDDDREGHREEWYVWQTCSLVAITSQSVLPQNIHVGLRYGSLDKILEEEMRLNWVGRTILDDAHEEGIFDKNTMSHQIASM